MSKSVSPILGDVVTIKGSTILFCVTERSAVVVPEGHIYIEQEIGVGRVVPVSDISSVNLVRC